MAEGRRTPKGREASGGGRKGGGIPKTPKTARTPSGTAKTPRKGARPTGTSGSANYGRGTSGSANHGRGTGESANHGRGRSAAGRAGQETRTSRAGRQAGTGRDGAGRDGAAGEGSRRAPRTPSTDRPRTPSTDRPRRTSRTSSPDRARELTTARGGEATRRTARPAAGTARPTAGTARPAAGTARPAASDGTRRTARPSATEGPRRTAGRSFGSGARTTAGRSTTRAFRGDGPRRTSENPAKESASLERGARTRPGGSGREGREGRPGGQGREGRERRGPADAGRRSWDGTAARPARTRGGDQVPDGDAAAHRPWEGRPRLPDTITAQQLDPEARAQLHSLPNDLADTIARYLVAAGTDRDPQQSYDYAQAARRLAARVGVVREASGIAAYRTGRWAEALSELRAARRLTGRDDYLPLMADCERALGRLDRALALIREVGASPLDRATQIELRIVESGIRRDQGLADAAVIALQVPELTSGRLRPWSARLFYAYADALLAAGRTEEARDAFARAAAADADGETDAADRLDELDGVEFEDLAESEDYPEDVTADPEDVAHPR